MMSISDIPPALSPISSTTSIQGLQTAMNNNSNTNSHITNSGTNSVSTSPHAYSLDRYHEPSSNEKFKRNGNSSSSNTNNNNGLGNTSKNMSLPPISSFDNLIRAAEKQYASTSNNNNNNTAMDQSQVSLSATTSMTSLPLSTNTNNVLLHPLQQGVMTPVGSRTNMLSYQLSTEQRHRAPITRSILQHPPSTATIEARSESNRSLLASPSDSMSRTSVSSSSSSTSASSSTSTTASKSIVGDYKLGGPQSQEPPLSLTTPTTTKVTKPRKKKQCPICLNYYANLSTHKSTHLTPEDRPHRCPVCERGFARNNDLIRHRKRHWKDELMSPATSANNGSSKDKSSANSQALSKQSQLRSLHQIKGTFKCPFNSNLIKLDMEVYPHKNKTLPFETSNCHQTGVFSRCDTYKNHLKALHFEYPPGTKKRIEGSFLGNANIVVQNLKMWIRG
ncbi:hypothetical protein C6P45_003084 [Maudiozyma exigua]|uniref:C2H2-type domain-containing protein n=1 Tax=Maudiozyma exigua TaxID=34358 RepID=A0A9P6WFJ9_MAUEX|nr:hypothetical protein C6P45_003084 [Kazachstania exigua]